MERDVKSLRIIGHDASSFFVIDENRKTNFLRLTAYHLENSTTHWVEKIQLEEDEKLESVSFLDSTFVLFTSKTDQSNKETSIFCLLLDHLGKTKSDKKQIHQTTFSNTSNQPEFGITFSPDSTRLLLYFDPPYERKSSEAISFKCYSKDIELIWEKEILLPYTQEIVQVHSFLLDNAGELYMMSGRNPAKDGKLWQKPQGARYVVFYYNAKTNKLKEYDISLKDKQVMSVIFQLNQKQDVIITGYYSNDFHFNAAGTIQFVIGAHGASVKSANFMPFSKDFLLQFMGEGDLKRNPALPDFYLDHMLISPEGEVLLIGEQYYVSQNTITDPTTGRQTIEYRYNFDELILTKTDSTGKHLWNQKISKRQFTISDTRNCSYLCFQTGDSLSFYFNDDPDNTELLAADPNDQPSAFMGSKSSVTTRVQAHSDGSVTRTTLIQNKEKDSLLNTYYGLRSISGPQILGYEDGKKFRFCIVR